jgi:DNA-binding transcriptional MocR family regulator
MTTTPAWEPTLARRAGRMRASEIRELLKLLEKPGIISFAGGIPDPALFPVARVSSAYAQILSDPALAATALQYSTSEGYGPLREWIAADMSARGVPATADNILITSGSQQALEFLGKLFLDTGDTALVTAPTYLGALQAFAAYEPRYDTLRPGIGNETPAALSARAAANGGRLKFMYLVPDFANPTGETLSRAARLHTIQLARDLDLPVIEDAAYTALRLEGDDEPLLQALDTAQHGGNIEQSRVIHCGTFSKTLTPGLRVGWVCAATSVIRRLVLIKQASDLNSSLINQIVLHRLAGHDFADQVTRARDTYRRRRDAMLAALEAAGLDGVSWTRPEGGLFIWLTLPENVDGAALLQRSIAEANVAFVPGAAFFTDGSGRNTLRLSYSLASEDQIRDGIARLAAVIRKR